MHEPILELALSLISTTLSISSLFIIGIITLFAIVRLTAATKFAPTLLAAYWVSFDAFSISFLLHSHFLIVLSQKMNSVLFS